MDLNGFKNIFLQQQNYFFTHETKSYQYRIEQLNQLETLVQRYTPQICTALLKDLKKQQAEAMMSEVLVVLEEIKYAKKNLKKWMKPKSVKTPIFLQPGKSKIHFEPRGVNLIIGPWNYPFQLMISPLVGSIAAGNCAVLKPSELATQTSELIKEMINNHFHLNTVLL